MQINDAQVHIRHGYAHGVVPLGNGDLLREMEPPFLSTIHKVRVMRRALSAWLGWP